MPSNFEKFFRKRIKDKNKMRWLKWYKHKFHDRLSIIALVYSVVLALPPTSPVSHFPYFITLNTDPSILSA